MKKSKGRTKSAVVTFEVPVVHSEVVPQRELRFAFEERASRQFADGVEYEWSDLLAARHSSHRALFA